MVEDQARMDGKADDECPVCKRGGLGGSLPCPSDVNRTMRRCKFCRSIKFDDGTHIQGKAP